MYSGNGLHIKGTDGSRLGVWAFTGHRRDRLVFGGEEKIGFTLYNGGFYGLCAGTVNDAHHRSIFAIMRNDARETWREEEGERG